MSKNKFQAQASSKVFSSDLAPEQPVVDEVPASAVEKAPVLVELVTVIPVHRDMYHPFCQLWITGEGRVLPMDSWLQSQIDAKLLAVVK